MSGQREQKSKSFVVCPSRDAGPHNLSSGQLNEVCVCVLDATKFLSTITCSKEKLT